MFYITPGVSISENAEMSSGEHLKIAFCGLLYDLNIEALTEKRCLLKGRKQRYIERSGCFKHQENLSSLNIAHTKSTSPCVLHGSTVIHTAVSLVRPFIVVPPALGADLFCLCHIETFEDEIKLSGQFRIPDAGVTVEDVCRITILNGPVVCFTARDVFYYTTPCRTDSCDLVVMGISLSELGHSDASLLHVSMFDGVIIGIGESKQRRRAFDDQEKHQQPDEHIFSFCMPPLGYDQGNGADGDNFATVCVSWKNLPSQIFFPQEYDNIIECMLIVEYEPMRQYYDGTEVCRVDKFTSGDRDSCTLRSDASPICCIDEGQSMDFRRNSVYLVTKKSQLLEFKNGIVNNCVQISVNGASSISVFETFESTEYICVLNQSGEALFVQRSTFEVVLQVSSVDACFIDDFVGNGADQVLLVFRHDTECERQKQADHAEFMFMLNDFGGIYIDTRREQSQICHDDDLSEHSQTKDGKTLLSAIQALKLRLDGGYSELKEAEMAYERNNMLIQETCEVVNNVALERDTKTEGNLWLVDVFGPPTLEVPLPHMDDKDKPAVATQLMASRTQQGIKETSTGHVHTRRFEGAGVHVTSVSNHLVGGCWVIRVDLENSSNMPMNIPRILLLEMESSNVPIVYHSRAFQHLDVSRNLGSGIFAEPLPKKVCGAVGGNQLDQSEPMRGPEQETTRLAPGSGGRVTAWMDIPRFAGEAHREFKLMLVWEGPASTNSVPGEVSGLADFTSTQASGALSEGSSGGEPPDSGRYDKTQWLDCGKISLSVADVLDSSQVDHCSGKKCADPDYQRNLEIIQQHIFLAITSTVSSLQVLDGALSQLGYTADRVSGHWGHRETGGSLQWTTVRITQRTRHSVTVRVGYREEQQLLLLLHALYSKLPDDVEILPASGHTSAAWRKSLLACRQELHVTKTSLKQLSSAPIGTKPTVATGATAEQEEPAGNPQTVFASRQLCQREQLDNVCDGDRYGNCFVKRQNAKATTDSAVMELSKFYH